MYVSLVTPLFSFVNLMVFVWVYIAEVWLCQVFLMTANIFSFVVISVFFGFF